MADPKIRYDIEANVQGGANVEQLASGIEKLSETLDGDLKKSALASADALRQLGQKDGAIQTFVDLKKKAQDSAIGLKDAQEAAQKLGAELNGVQTPTRAQTGQLQKLRDAVRDAKTEVVANNAALIAARDGLSKYGVSTDNLGQSQRNVKAALASARTEVAAMAPAWQAAANGANDSANKQNKAAKQVESGLDGLKNQLNSLRNIAVAALGGSYLGSMLKDVSDTADAYNNLQARMKLVTGEGAAFESSFESVTAVALRTNSSLESTGTLFARIAEAGKSAGLGSQAAIAQALSLTETVNQAVAVSGASAQASDAAITQLIQGLQSGVLRGDEFNSVMEQAPRLAKALAEGLQVTTGELRKMAEAGQLSSDVVIKSLQGQSDAVASEFTKLPPTVGRAIQNLSTSWTLYVGEVDKATGASSTAAKAINLLSSNLSTVAGFLLDAGQAAAAFVALRLAQHFAAVAVSANQATVAVAANAVAMRSASVGAGLATGAMRLMSLAMRAIPGFSLLYLITNFHDIGVSIGEAAAKLMGFKDRTKELAEQEKAQALAIAETAAQRTRMQAATQAAIEKQFELSAAARTSIGEFDKLVKAGSTAAEAVAKIGKDFDLTTSPGIINASAVLDKLAADGKLSADQFRTAWSEALKTTDLAVFETQARAALAGTAREAERVAQVLDATLRTAVLRTGLDFEVISGGMGKASRSAINDTDAIIQGLDRLKKQGVDTGQALVASFAKGINTADSQKAIEAVRLQIEGVRRALGDQVANGLLDQATKKASELRDALDGATPGINSVREAMKQLGVVSDQTFTDAAAKSREAYEILRASGTASVRELADGFKKYATDAIAANKGVASEALKSEAAMRGIELQVDSTGKSIVRAMDGGSQSVRTFSAAAGQSLKEIEAIAAALDAVNARYNQSKADLAGKYSRPGEGPNRSVLTKDNMQGVDNTGLFSLQQKNSSGTLTAGDLATAQAAYNAAATNLDVYQKNWSVFSLEGARSTEAAFNEARAILERVKGLSGQSGNGSSGSTSATVVSSKTVNVKITLPNGQIQSVPTTEDGSAALIAALRGAKLSAGL